MVAISKEIKISLTLTAIVLFIIVIAMYLWSCISPAKKIRVTDVNNSPIANAYIIYLYTGTVSRGPAGSDDYHQPGSIAQTNKDGYFTIPSKMQLHLPLIKSKVYPEITAIYDPHTHCVGLLPNKKGSDWPKWDYFLANYWWFKVEDANNTDVLIFHDVTIKPVNWYASINQLHSALRNYQIEIVNSGWKAPLEKRKTLYNYLLQEYKSFENKYGDQKCGIAEDLKKLDRLFGQGHAKNIKDKTFRELIDNDIRSLQNEAIWSSYKSNK
jgi:hypothetical protein